MNSAPRSSMWSDRKSRSRPSRSGLTTTSTCGGPTCSTRSRSVDAGDGVVVLTDMFGGTPSNLAISAMERANVEVIAGVNLPMLVKLASVRGECGLEEAVTSGAGGRPEIYQRRQPDPRRQLRAST